MPPAMMGRGDGPGRASTTRPGTAKRRASARPRITTVLLVAVPFTVLFIVPLLAVVAGGLEPEAFVAPAVLEALRFGAWQAFWAGVLAVAAGLGLAALHRRAFAGRGLIVGLHTLTFVMPVFVVAYGLQGLLGGGSWLAAQGFDVLDVIGPTGAVVLAHAYYNHGFAALLLGEALDRRPRTLEDAARTAGASDVAVRWRVTLPLLLPAILATFLLVFLFSFTAFGTVLILGEARVANLQMIVYGATQSIFPRPDIAAAAGLLELAVNATLLVAALALRRRFERQTPEPDRARRPATNRAAVAAYVLAVVAMLPLLAVFVQGFRLDGSWSLVPWRSLVDASGALGQFDFARATINSLTWAAASTLLAVLLVIAWLPRRRLESWASLPLAVSPLFLALGLLALYGPAGFDVGRPLLLTLGHTALVLPFLARLVLPVAAQTEPVLLDAARVLGASPGALLWRIHVPLVRRALVSGAALAAALSLSDLTMSTTLANTDTAGLAVWIQRLNGPFLEIRHARAVALTTWLALLVTLLFAASTLRRRTPTP